MEIRTNKTRRRPWLRITQPVEPAGDAFLGPVVGLVLGGHPSRSWADRTGIFLSLLCLVHCVLTPFILLVFPALEAFGLAKFHETFHVALLLLLPLVAVLAFIPGYRRHRDWRVFAWAFPGFVLIALVALVFDDSSWTTTLVSVCGSLFLIRSHLINRRLCACCEQDSGHKVSVALAASKPRLLTPPRRH